MKILVISYDYPEPMAGAAAKETYSLINSWAAQGHTVACIAASPLRNQSIAGSSEMDVHVAATLPGPFRVPFRSWHFSAAFRSLAATLAKDADLVFGQEIWTADVDVGRPKVVSVLYLPKLDRIGRLPGSARSLERNYMIRRLLGKADVIRILGDHMRTGLKRKENDRAAVVPFALDTSLFSIAPILTKGVPLTFGTIVNRKWGPSSYAGDQYLFNVLPRIRSLEPDGRHVIGGYGVDPDQNHWPAGAEVWGSFRDIRAFMKAIDVLVVPGSIGSGVRVKILEALASGIPVVGAEAAANGILRDAVSLAVAPDGLRTGISSDDLAVAAIRAARHRRLIGPQRELREYVEQYHNPMTVASAIIAQAEARSVV